jgi:predicted dehydrogenase
MAIAPGEKGIRCGIIGYGGAFNMGKAHSNWINAVPGMQVTAVCDLDPERTAVAKQDFPEIETYNDVAVMLEKAPIDLCVLITPHNTHAPLAVQCLKAGKHVITEKPMCLTTSEATNMIDEARAAGKMLSVFHNRRWDGDYMAIQDVVDKGIIGEVFHVEMYGGGYGHPGKWWRADKAISGGAFYDWGAHYLYWLLRIIPDPLQSVTGFYHKRVWHDVTNEDQVEAAILFKTGKVANVQMSSIAMAGKPRWRILGTKGAIVDHGGGSFKVYTDVQGLKAEAEVKYRPGQWEKYYENIGDHLLRGGQLEITPESARRVIEIIDYAEVSARSGQTERLPYP